MRKLLFTGVAVPASILAQTVPLPPVHPLGPIVARSADTIKTIRGFRLLSDGRFYVSDATGKRLILFDSTLAHGTVVADTTSSATRAYAGLTPTVLAFFADTTLLYDMRAQGFVVFDPKGVIVRTIAMPQAPPLSMMTFSTTTMAFDQRGSIVMSQTMRALRRPPGGGADPESTIVVRANLATRLFDTLAYVKAQRPDRLVLGGSGGPVGYINPVPVSDDWVVTPDGRVAILRANDFHIDVFDAAGHWTALPKIPFPWTRITDDDRDALLDSAKRRATRMNAIDSSRAAGPPTVIGNITLSSTRIRYEAMTASDIPDFRSPAMPGMIATPDGGFWIPMAPVPHDSGGTTYDVVSRDGALVDRVQLPRGTSLVAIAGPNTAYVRSIIGPGLIQLARARIR